MSPKEMLMIPISLGETAMFRRQALAEDIIAVYGAINSINFILNMAKMKEILM
jgi:hypothetical protein